jgi:hypothetical protein
MSDMCYITRRPCGCISGACVDLPEYTKDTATAKWVAGWVKQGRPVERITDEEVRASRWKCEVCRPPKPEELPLEDSPC